MAAISRLDQLKDLHANAFTFLHGIERETLRVSADGKISQKPHPAGLGSALTNGAITTDYSEALLEFITGVHEDKSSLLQELSELHRFAYSQLDQEMFWLGSMPAVLPEQEQIPIAQYGSSHIGRLKTIYRHGLWHRYGRKMQTIAGLHFNWSLSNEFWRQWALVNGKTGDLTQFKTDEYFGLIRSFRRHSWLLLYLFGASPVADKSFLDHHSEQLQTLGSESLYAPYATSLRMSDLGYSNQAQSQLFVCFNSLQTYADTLIHAIQQPYPAYQQIGKRDASGYKQLNENILQIENEYYSDIRPKRVAYSGEKPLHALRKRGVEYIEVRCLDVNPFNPLGIDETSVHFLDLFLLWCLVQDSYQISPEECDLLQKNSALVALRGRDPELEIIHRGQPRKLPELASQLLDSICQFAQIIDGQQGSDLYRNACQAQRDKVNDVTLTPSSQVLEEVKRQGSYREFTLQQAKQFTAYFEQPLAPERQHHWQQESDDSRVRQQDLEASDQGSFDDFVNEYLAQY